MALVNKYGHLSRHKRQGDTFWRWVIIGLIGLWCLAVITWSAEMKSAQGFRPHK